MVWDQRNVPLASHSPGTALLGYAIEQAIGEGVCEFDFLRKTEEFKHRWGAVDRAKTQLILHHEGSRMRSTVAQNAT